MIGIVSQIMILLSILDQLNVSDTTLAIIAGSVSAFFGGFFAILRLLVTKPEREADAAMDTAKAFEILAAQIVKSGDRSDKLFDRVVAMGERQDAEREMYRQRDKERDEQHKTQIQALEKSNIDAQTQIGDLTEHITNLQNIQDKLKADYSIQEQLVKEQGKRIKSLEESETQAHRLVIEKDLKITELEKRVKELEADIARLKAQQQPAPIPVIVASIGATSEPLTPADTREFADIIAETRESTQKDTSAAAGETTTPAPGGSESVGQ